MPKKVKTRKQKILADLRRKVAPVEVKKVDSATYSLPSQKSSSISHPVAAKSKSNNQATITTNSYSYLSSDLRRTILLTSAIIIAEIVIRFTVKGI